MVSVSQVSIEKEDSDVPRERVQNEVEDSDVARKRHVQEVSTAKEITGIDEVSDSHSSGSVIQASSKTPKVDYNIGSTSFKVPIEKKDSDVPRKRRQNEVEDSDVARQRRVQEASTYTTREIIGNDEVSDSHSSGSVIQASSKRPKVDDNVGSTSFKGVVPRPNGHWGAQICANHRNIWLGTFSSEKEAAMVYDSAAIKVRSCSSSSIDSQRNIPFTDITIHEPDFQSQFTTEAVLNMIREGSYVSKFYDYLKKQSLVEQKPCSHKGDEFFCKKLFQKVVCPSDVSKFTRLVIPKNFAVTHLHGTSDGKDSEIVCYDRLKKEWKFQLSYLSNQSFAFTRGWKAFVEAKNVKAKDIIVFFSRCQYSSEKNDTAFGIDVEPYNELHENNDGQNNTLEKEDDLLNTTEKEKEKEKEKDLSQEDSNSSRSQGRLRLFGVQIK